MTSTARTAPILGLGLAALVLPLTTVVSHTFGRATYPLLLPAIKDELTLSDTVAGVGGTVIYVAYMAGVVLVTFLAGRVEPMAILRAGVATSAVGLALLSVASSTPILFAGLSLASGGGAGIWITAPALATEDVPPERRGFVIGFLTASIGLGTSVLAFGTRSLRSAAGNEDLWRPVYAAEAAVAVVILVVVAVLVRTRATAALTGGISLDSLRMLVHWRRITAAYVVFGVIAAGYTTFLAEAMEEEAGLSRAAVANVYIGMGLMSVITAPLVGAISDRVGRRTAKMAVMVALMAGSAAVAIGGRWLVPLSVLAIGGMWSSYPTLTATYVRDYLDARQFGAAYGTMTIFYGVAAVFAPVGVGALADALGGFRVPYLVVAGTALAGAAILASIPAGPGPSSAPGGE